MPMAKEPRPASFYKLTINGHETIGLFRSVTINKANTDVIDFKEIDAQGKPFLRRVPGFNAGGEIVVERGIDTNKALSDWYKKINESGVEDGAARCDGTITLHDHLGGQIAAWSFKQAWPSAIEWGKVDANSNDIAVEKATLTHEGIWREA
jgi:phage tail-like protein